MRSKVYPGLQTQPRALRQKDICRIINKLYLFPILRLELPANLTGLVRIAVHIDVEVSGEEFLQLIGSELGAGRHGPGALRALGESDDRLAILTRCSLMNVSHDALHAMGGDLAGHRAIGRNLDHAGTVAIVFTAGTSCLPVSLT